MQDFIYVNCDNGEQIPLRPVKWNLRKAGDPNTLVSGGAKDMVHVVSLPPKGSAESTYPASISVMGQMWELQLSWDALCERIEREARIDANNRRAATLADQREIDEYAEYDMSKYVKA